MFPNTSPCQPCPPAVVVSVGLCAEFAQLPLHGGGKRPRPSANLRTEVILMGPALGRPPAPRKTASFRKIQRCAFPLTLYAECRFERLSARRPMPLERWKRRRDKARGM